MFKILHYSLVLALLLTSSGVQLMGCVDDPSHQGCQIGQAAKVGSHPGCKGHGKAPEAPSKQSQNPMMPIACIQACNAALTSLHPRDGLQVNRPQVTLGTLVQTAEVVIDLSEPRAVFHPPA